MSINSICTLFFCELCCNSAPKGLITQPCIQCTSTSLRYDVTIVPPGTVSRSHFESVPGWPNFLPFEASDWFRICASESHRAPPLEAQLVDVGPWSRKEQE